MLTHKIKTKSKKYLPFWPAVTSHGIFTNKQKETKAVLAFTTTARN
jgi:hypothetical protein